MSDLRTILERGAGGATPPPDGFERMLHRRDRKRRNQRIAAGVVGIAVFVVAVWIVTSVGSFDRTQTAVPGPAETGPTLPASVGTVTFDGSTCSIEFTADRIEPGVVVFDIVNARGAPTTFDAWTLMEGYTFREFERAVENATPAPGEPREEAFAGEPKIAYLGSRYSPSNDSGTLVTTMSAGTHAIVCLTRTDIFIHPVGIAGPIVVGTEPTESGPAEIGVENPEPVQIGTVTQSGDACAFQPDAESIPAGPGRLTLVNETNRWVSFELSRFDPEVLTFARFEAIVAKGESSEPPGAFVLVQREVGPAASGTITDNFTTTTDAFAVVCLNHRRPAAEPLIVGSPYRYAPFDLVGPIAP